MAGEWERRRLGDVITLKRGYDLPKSQRVEGAVPVVSSGGISGSHAESMAAGPGVVTGRYGTIGLVHYVEGPFWPLNTTLYVKDFKGSDPRFVYFALKNFDFHAYSDKAAVPGVNRNEIHNAEVDWPSVGEQIEIAAVLGAIEAKISIGREIHSILSSLIDTEFSKQFLWPIQQSLPLSGWHSGSLGDLLSQRSERVGRISEPVVLSAVSSGELVHSDAHFDKQVYSASLKSYKIVEKGDFAYNPSRINIGSIGVHTEDGPGAVSPIYVVCRPKLGYGAFLKYFIRSASTKEIIGLLASGTVRQSLSYSDFASIKCPIPPLEVAEKFFEYVMDVEKVLKHVKEEERLLQGIVGRLLAPLVTGKLRVAKGGSVEVAA